MAKDTRKVVSGVQVYDGGELVTLTDPDEIAECCTAEEGKRLQESGALTGDGWHFKGKAPEKPMAGSPASRKEERPQPTLRRKRAEAAAEKEPTQAEAEAAGFMTDEPSKDEPAKSKSEAKGHATHAPHHKSDK